MRKASMSRAVVLIGAIAVAVLAGLPSTLNATQRAGLLELRWASAIPKPADPLLVYVVTGNEGRDQDRYDEVVMANESLLLAAKFFTCVQMSDDAAKKHPLFAEINVKGPSMVAFDSTRKQHAVAGGRASAMKVYGMLCKMGEVDYETSVATTVRAARNLLGSYDRMDAAQDALNIKRGRLDEARSEGNTQKILKLQKGVDKDQAALDELTEKTQTRWSEIWDLKRKTRESEKPERTE